MILFILLNPFDHADPAAAASEPPPVFIMPPLFYAELVAKKTWLLPWLWYCSFLYPHRGHNFCQSVTFLTQGRRQRKEAIHQGGFKVQSIRHDISLTDHSKFTKRILISVGEKFLLACLPTIIDFKGIT